MATLCMFLAKREVLVPPIKSSRYKYQYQVTLQQVQCGVKSQISTGCWFKNVKKFFHKLWPQCSRKKMKYPLPWTSPQAPSTWKNCRCTANWTFSSAFSINVQNSETGEVKLPSGRNQSVPGEPWNHLNISLEKTLDILSHWPRDLLDALHLWSPITWTPFMQQSLLSAPSLWPSYLCVTNLPGRITGSKAIIRLLGYPLELVPSQENQNQKLLLTKRVLVHRL